MRKFYLNANVPGVEISPHYAHRKPVKKRAVFYGANAAGVALVTGPRSRSTVCSRSAGHEVSATNEECKGLEIMSTWFSNHIEDRLEDYFSGREYRDAIAIKKHLGIDF